MHNRHQDKELYFQEQVFTTREHVIPFIEKHRKIDETIMVMEVGCGEGGNLLPFLEKGCHAVGIDISQSKIDYASQFLSRNNHNGKLTLIADDVYNLQSQFSNFFDIIILRDVIEHIHDQSRFMKFIRDFLKPGGVIFFGFPPWYNPFGGHQQICQNRILSKLPYYHLFPSKLYAGILKAGGEPLHRIKELLEIKETGISLERFEKITRKHHFTILERCLYLFNPNYQVKFNIKPRKQFPLISRIPYFRNFLTTACYYLVTVD